MHPTPTKPSAPRGPRRLLIAAAIAIVVAGLAIATRTGPQSEHPEREAPPQASEHPLPTAAPNPNPAQDGIDDDGRSPWISPTTGPPLDLAGLPPGVQVILHLRPRAILEHPEGEKLLAAFGPLSSQALEQIQAAVDRPPEEIDHLLIGWQLSRDGAWQATILDAASTEPAPPLPRDLERLIPHTDSTRQLTLLFRPSFLFGDGHAIFAGPMSALRGPLFWFFGDEIGAAAVSLHCDDNFFVELVAVPTLDTRPDRTADELIGRLQQTPTRLDDYLAGHEPTPYARRLLDRFPAMVRQLAVYTRARYDRDVVELRAYLPAVAGHNLLMGAELALAEALRPAMSHDPAASRTTSPTADSPAAIAERLQTRTSLRFPRDTLDAALRLLSDDIGVPIVIRGADLQLEGITKNQSFTIDISDCPAEEILVAILRLANPDRLATSPADPRQKLVYTLGHDPTTDRPAIIITTRTQATTRNEPLPTPFVTTP